jgi:hypothetical protein
VRSFDHCFYLLVTDRCTLHVHRSLGTQWIGATPPFFRSPYLQIWRPCTFVGSRTEVYFYVSPPFHKTVVDCQLTPPSTFLSYSSTIIYIMFPLCECPGICEFEQDSSLFPNIVLTAEVNAQVKQARGVVVTPKLYRKLGYRVLW